MKTREQRSALREALATLEKCLETPVVPGELPEWAERAQAACRDVESHLKREIDEVHPEMFRQIRGEDPGLAPRVDDLREEDKNLLEKMGRVASYLDRLRPAAGAVEPEENRMEEYVQKAVDAGLELVLAVRKQETAISTWYMEALERDRGRAD